ncbi:hypothetical protein F4604DRAFT_1916391 [Suillus subluteus]|nr:hypothetical protein F4604DRAFT_1916391 [Suillus subluteus]
MFPSKALLSIVLIALSAVDASPLRREAAPTLAFNARMNARASDANIADADRARAQAMINASFSKRAGSSSFSIASAVTAYTAQVGVGSPATQYTLLIDTGSSNTWVGANTPYTRTNTSVDTGLRGDLNTVLDDLGDIEYGRKHQSLRPSTTHEPNKR